MHGRLRLTAAIVIVASLTVPGASIAGWQAGSGHPEPSTAWDTSRHMFQSPNQAPADRIYFNGMVLSSAGPVTYDAQLDGGSLVSPVATTHAAILGFWRDCNRDGYIGAKVLPANAGSFSAYPRLLAENGVLPFDGGICPLGSAYNPRDPVSGEPMPFIDELRWIGPNAMWSLGGQENYNVECGSVPQPTAAGVIDFVLSGIVNCLTTHAQTPDRTDVNDPNARVWADWNAPSLPHVEDGGLLSPGAFEDSASTLDYVDYHTGRTMSQGLGEAWTELPNVGECDADDPELLEGPDDSCGAWPLYQVKRLVNDSDGVDGPESHPEPLVTVFDVEENTGGPTSSPCDDAYSTDIPRIVFISGHPFRLPDPDPDVHRNFPVEGSLAGTATHAWKATDGGLFTGECSTRAPSLLAVDSAADEILTTHVRPDVQLSFVADSRVHALRFAGFEDLPADALGARGTAGVDGVPGWYGRQYAMVPPRHLWGSFEPVRVTFYADVSNTALTNAGASASVAFPGGVQNRHAYGLPEFCTTITTGPANVHAANRWDCSVTSWAAKRERDNAFKRPILGDPYDLRDVDCLDNDASETLLGPDVRAGLADCATQ